MAWRERVIGGCGVQRWFDTAIMLSILIGNEMERTREKCTKLTKKQDQNSGDSGKSKSLDLV